VVSGLERFHQSQTAASSANEVKEPSLNIYGVVIISQRRARHKSDFVNKYYARVYAESWAALQKVSALCSDASLSQTE